jgi:hypothetical protein
MFFYGFFFSIDALLRELEGCPPIIDDKDYDP